MGGKSRGSNDQMLEFQKQQAAEARQKEIDRQNRLNAGKASIDALFDPSGFDPLYNRFQQASLDYTLPQLQEQYDKQKEQLTYALANAGTSNSSIAADQQADIEKQRIQREGELRARAEGDLANFKTSMGEQKQSALSQLYATEDPDVAANTATHMVQNANLAMPNLNPLGELFKPLVIGATTGVSSFLDNQNFNAALQRARRPSVDITGSTGQG
jgi:DNA-directed RNA polymerase beta subunit